jgi:hypothetical protein
MPTRAPEGLFSPDHYKVQVRPVLNLALPLLNEVLAYGLALFGRCSTRPDGDDENLAIIMTYRHLLEMLDSVTIQVAECAPSPAGLQLRSMFDALLTIQYISEDKSKSVQRAFALLYEVQIQRRRFYSSQKPDTPEGKAVREFIAGDPFSADWKPYDDPDLDEYIREVDVMLERPIIKQIAAEYRRLKKEKKRKPHWYGLYDGPQHVSELAKRLKRGAAYEMLYKEWSERSHSIDAIDRFLTHNTDGPAVRALRDPTEITANIDFAISFSIDAARCLIDYYRPAERPAFDKWVREEIMPNWKKLPHPESQRKRNFAVGI